MVCEWCVISYMLSADNNDGLTPPLYAADKPYDEEAGTIPL